MARLDVNMQAPNFSLPDFNGELFELSKYQGKSHILVVFNRGFI